MHSDIDWFRLLVQLKEQGHSLGAVSQITNIPKSTLNDYKQGAEPRHSHGERLLAFWARATGQGRDQAPVHSQYLISTATCA